MIKWIGPVFILCATIIAQSALAIPQTTQPAAEASPAANVGPDTPVITVRGVCEHPPSQKPGPDCKKVITRAQFESMIQTVRPNLPASERREFAERYVEALVADEQARDMGITQGEKFEVRSRVARAQAMSQELSIALYEKASEISEQDLENYYRQHPDLFIEADLTRMLIPGIQQLPPPDQTLSDEERGKRDHDSETLMKETAERLRLRAVAGEDLEKLQAEAFQIALVQGEAPSTKMGKVRGMDLPPSQLPVMEVKAGGVSGLLPDRRGYLIYRVGEKRVLPLAEVKDEIRKRITDERFQAENDAVMNAAKITLDETYFGK